MIAHFFQCYLFAFVFWFGLAVGSLGVLLMHHLTGGAWGELIRAPLESATLTLPWLWVLFIPVLLGLRHLYPWLSPEMATDPVLKHKAIYLNLPFFCLRAAGYFLLFGMMGRYFGRRAAPPDEVYGRSGPALVVYALALTFCYLDWLMSLEPHWYSTVFEAMVMVTQMLTAMAFATCCLSWFGEKAGEEQKPFIDLGNMLLAFVMLSAYMAFAQYLVIWSGNIPEEIAWYLRRQEGLWFWTAMAVVLLQFCIPFLALLGRGNKAVLGRMASIAGMLLIAGIIHTFWWVRPAFKSGVLRFLWLDVLVFCAMGVIWMGLFSRELKRWRA